MNLSSVIYYCAVLAVTAGMTWWAWRQWKQYRLAFLRDFFIFILTFNVYGFLNFTGQVFLVRIYPDGGFDQILGNLIVFTLAVPVMAVWIYFFILWMTRICSIELHRRFRPAYWVINAILILTNFYAIHVLIDTRDPYATKLILFWKVPFYICLFLGTSIVALIRSGRLKTAYRKQFVRFLSLAYMAGFVFMVVFGDIVSLPFYTDRFLYLVFLSIIYFSINILPAWYISSSLKSHLNELSSLKSGDIDPSGEFASEFRLTRREREVAELAIQGMSNEDIAGSLHISVQTVKNNMSAIFRKTGVKNRVQLGNILRNYEDNVN